MCRVDLVSVRVRVIRPSTIEEVSQPRGRLLSIPGETLIARNLRRHREAQGISLRALAYRSGISQNLIVDFEHSRRTPTPDQHRTLLAVLGVGEAGARQSGLRVETLTALAACLAWTHGVALAALADALGLTIAEVRDGIEQTRDRLRAIGLEVFVDQRRARVLPLSWCERPIRAVTSVPPISVDDLRVLSLLHQQAGARLTDLEATAEGPIRNILASLLDRGLVGCSSGGPVADRIYWISYKGLASAAAWALTGTH